MSPGLRILVLGYIVRGPIGGLAWHHLQYVRGLVDLGHEVIFLEDSEEYPACYDPVHGGVTTDASYGLSFTGSAFERIGLGDSWAYYDAHSQQWRGPRAGRALADIRRADLLLNVSGVNPLRSWFDPVPHRVLIDTDPVFTQVAHLTECDRLARATQHTAFFTFAEQYGQLDCLVPDDGLPWKPTRQPVVPGLWRVTSTPSAGRFTTVMQWDSYEAREYAGIRYGMKSESFTPYLDLPAQSGQPLELAIGGHPPRRLLRRHGWQLRDSLLVTRDPWTYQRYLQRSKGEFSVAKHGYVISKGGWFSERSLAYMASGRPVIVQETGFSSLFPTGLGVVPFSTPEEALAALDDVNSRYALHCRAAREIAEEHFSAGTVLTSLIERTLSR